MPHPSQLLAAYSLGIFPMSDSNGEVSWYRPDPRGILPLEELNVPESLARTIRQGLYQVHWNRDFEGMLQGCAHRPETWLQPELAQAVLELHQRGYAHSVECWDEQGLAGGLYGIALGGAFFGESMNLSQIRLRYSWIAASSTKPRKFDT